MTTIIHIGLSRTRAVTRLDGTPIVSLHATSSVPTLVTATVNPDGTVTRRAVAPGIATITYADSGANSLAETVSVPTPPNTDLVLGTDGPEV